MTHAPLQLLCAGAAQGLVAALAPRWTETAGAAPGGRFGAVGAMKEALLAGAACDVMVVTDTMIDALVADGLLLAATRATLGRVRTGIAVPSGAPRPDVSDASALAAALHAAGAVYFPDPQRATAGIHFAKILRELGLHEALAARLRTFPNGATAMREMAAGRVDAAIGCTQISEILFAQGVELVAPLPQRFELATAYGAAVSAAAAQPELAARFVSLLTGADSRPLRRACGFEDSSL